MDAEDTETTAAQARTKRLRDIHAKAMERFRACVDQGQIDMRAMALEARRFVSIPGAQWEGQWGQQFENSIRVEIPKVQRGVRKIEIDYRSNRIVPDFRPAGGDSSQDTADTLDGLHRADSYHFKAQQARDNAFSEAVKGGFGAYRLCTEYADPLDPENEEQRVNPGMTIVDADQRVFFDANSKLYDKSDARFAFVLTAKTPEAFAEDHGEERLTSWPDELPRNCFDWFTPDQVIVAEYYDVEIKPDTLHVFTHELTGDKQRFWDDEIDGDEKAALRAKGYRVASREVDRRRVRKFTLSGAEVLAEGGYIAGQSIPIVPVYGNREFVDGMERFKGHVQDKMDAQRLYNSNVSRLAEINALAPRETPVFAVGQIDTNLADQWANANVNRSPFLLVNPLLNPDGNSYAALGEIGKVSPPSVEPVTAALMQISAGDLTDDDQDGADEVKANVSEEAMSLAAARVDAKSGIYLDNMRQSVQREGEIYLEMARDVYFEADRVVETMTEEGDDGTATLMEPVTDEKGRFSVRNDLQRGRYKVVADVTEATSTRREKTVKRCLEGADLAIKAGDQEAAQAWLGTAVLNTDGEGISDLQAWYRKRLLAAGVVKPTEEEQREMEAAAEQQQPDATQQALMAQAEELQASAALKTAQAGKAEADTKLSGAKVIETLASAAQKGANADKMEREGLMPANDGPPAPRIARGYDMGSATTRP